MSRRKNDPLRPLTGPERATLEQVARGQRERPIKIHNDIQQEAYDTVAHVPLVSAVQAFAVQGCMKGVEPSIGGAYYFRFWRTPGSMRNRRQRATGGAVPEAR